MSTQKEEKQHFAARITKRTVRRVRWLASRDLSGPVRVGETVEMLLREALDARGVPQEVGGEDGRS